MTCALDFSQADDLAPKQPEKLAQMKSLFLDAAKANKAFPIGAGNWLRIHPEDRVKTPYTSWNFDFDHAAHARVHGAGPW